VTSGKSGNILIIDDEPGVCDLVRRVAEGEGFHVVTTGSHAEFVAAYDAAEPSHMFLDLLLPDGDGIGLLSTLAERACKGQIVIMSGTHPELLNSTSRLGRSYGLNIVGTLRKPFRATELRATLNLFG
jgi:DNA-binding response OmpR family regulator